MASRAHNSRGVEEAYGPARFRYHALLCPLACVFKATMTPIAPPSVDPSIVRPVVEALAHCCGIFVHARVVSEVVLAVFSISSVRE